MKTNAVLDRNFFQRETLLVAKQLIGKLLVRTIKNKRVSGIIYETEAYNGEQDLACHAHSGRSVRNAVMYGNGGYAYVYFTYGMHWLFNCVTGKKDFPAAVLIRAIYPLEGTDYIKTQRSPIKEQFWCNGPAKLTKALSITGKFNGVDLCSPFSPLVIEDGISIQENWITSTPRIGIDATPEPWKSLPWRFIANFDKLKSSLMKN